MCALIRQQQAAGRSRTEAYMCHGLGLRVPGLRRPRPIHAMRSESSGFVAYESNLGQLGRFAAEGQSTSDETSVLVQRVDPASFNERGLYMDGGAIFASSILLLVLLAFSTNRIFGLDRFVANASRTRREESRKKAMLKLQRMMGDEADPGTEDPSSGNAPNKMR